ncbi:MAG: thioredoxin family protein, partial [Candidatus Micrarchaeota archaeon]
ETEPTPITSYLIEFYGRECPHCVRMMPVVAEVEAELGVTFSKLEVWHNSGNSRIFESYADKIGNACGGVGVPTFFNMRTGRAVCGEVPKSELLVLIKG